MSRERELPMRNPSPDVVGRNFLAGGRSTSVLSGRGRWLLSGVVTLVAAAALNWSWLAAAGIVPIVLAVFPCAMICALHLCAHRNGEHEPELTEQSRTD